MKKFIIGALITAALVLIPTQVKAAPLIDTGNDWLASCKSDETHGEIMWCLGYINALDHALVTWSYVMDKRYACPKGKYNIGQARDIVRRYLRDNPSKRTDAMMLIYIDAMSGAFPCK